MNAPVKKEYPLLPDDASKVFQFLRGEALKNRDAPLPNPYELSDYELTTLLIREAGAAMLVNPMDMIRDAYGERLYLLWNALRARLDGHKSPPHLPGEEVVVGKVVGQLGEYRELRKGDRYFVRQVFYKYEINNPYDPVWTVYITKDKAGEHPPLDGWRHYNADFFEKVTGQAAA